jgi:hypothetical protein
MFLSGSAFPFALLPDGMKRFARFLPTTYIVESLQGIIGRARIAETLAATGNGAHQTCSSLDGWQPARLCSCLQQQLRFRSLRKLAKSSDSPEPTRQARWW